MEYQSFGDKVKSTTKKAVRIFLLIVIVGGAGAFAFFYWGTYEDGMKSGMILQVSKKGYIFKTYEGKINLQTFGALKNASPFAESFDFSIEKSETELIKELEAVALSGERVNLYYIKRYMIFPWRGDTKNFAIRVERSEKK